MKSSCCVYDLSTVGIFTWSTGTLNFRGDADLLCELTDSSSIIEIISSGESDVQDLVSSYFNLAELLASVDDEGPGRTLALRLSQLSMERGLINLKVGPSDSSFAFRVLDTPCVSVISALLFPF